MSLAARKRTFKRLETLVTGKDPAIETILSEEQLHAALRQNNTAVTRYVVRHFLEIVKIAVEDKDTSSDQEVITATSILTDPSDALLQGFGNDRDLINAVVSCLGNDAKGCNCLFSFLKKAINCPRIEWLSKLQDPVGFYKNILKHAASPVAVDLLASLLEFERGSTLDFLEVIEADVLTLSLLHREERVARVGLKALRRIVAMSKPDHFAMKRMASPETLKMLIDYAFNAPTNELVMASFALVDDILARVQYDKDAINSILSESEQIGRYVASDGPFTPDKKAAAAVFLAIMKVTRVDCAKDVCISLFQKSLEQRTNSFLHQVWLDLFRSVADNEEQFRAMLQESNFLETLLDIEKNRGNVDTVGYWGHITQAAKLVVDKLGKDLNDQWREYVTDTLEPRLNVEAAPYGGEVPPKEPEFGYECNIIDSLEMLFLLHNQCGLEADEEEEEEEAAEDEDN